MPDQLFCYIRKRWITATPEEKIRQFLIRHMTENLGYPKSLLLIEKSLHQLPHLDPSVHSSLPARRIDLLVMAQNLHPRFPFYPLLLVECKAIPLNQKAMRQVIGYNHFLRACFVALANQDEIQLAWENPLKGSMEIFKGLPPFEVLFREAIDKVLPYC